MAASLDRLRQPPLMDSAITGDPARHDLPAVGYEPAQQPLVLIVDMLNLVFTEPADFPASPLGKFPVT